MAKLSHQPEDRLDGPIKLFTIVGMRNHRRHRCGRSRCPAADEAAPRRQSSGHRHDLAGAGSYAGALMDGAPMGPPNRSGTFPLANVDRGTHQLQVRIVNDAGEVLLNGQPSVFHLQRFSALQPGARR